MVVGACKLSYSGGWGRRIAWTWEAEVAVSQDHATALRPETQSETLLVSKQNKSMHVCNFVKLSRVKENEDHKESQNLVQSLPFNYQQNKEDS